jgi:hypothetical protein
MINLSNISLKFFSKRKNIVLVALFLILFVTVVSAIKTPIRQTFEYNTDEGIEAMKALLYSKGFHFYKEIWADQPPLFPVVLSFWFKLFGPSLYHIRVLVLIFSAILLLAFYLTLKNLWGRLCAFTACVFLILSMSYIRLSISGMAGIPALSLAMVSIYCVTLYTKSESKYGLIISGTFMALSLQTKLFTAFLIPVIASEIIQVKRQSLKGRIKRKQCIPPLLLWFSALLIIFLIITIIFFRIDFSMFFEQLIKPHLKKLNLPGSGFSTIQRMILADYDIALLALIGVILIIRQKRWRFLFPALWLGLALAILLKNRPIWYHYYLLLSIPISWLAAISFSNFFFIDMQKGKRIAMGNEYRGLDIFLSCITAAIIILTILKMPGKYTRMKNSVWAEAGSKEYKIVDLLSKYKKHTRWIFTDRPIFAFSANILTPPELTLVSEKRDFKDTQAQNYFIDKLERYKPGLMLLNPRNDCEYYGPQAISYIQKNYFKIYDDEFTQRIQNSHIYKFDICWLWEPIGKYLPARIQVVTEKRFYNLVWHLMRIPVPKVSKISNYTYNRVNIKIFLRKDLAGEK